MVDRAIAKGNYVVLGTYEDERALVEMKSTHARETCELFTKMATTLTGGRYTVLDAVDEDGRHCLAVGGPNHNVVLFGMTKEVFDTHTATKH